MPAPSIVSDTGPVITNATTENQSVSFASPPAAGNAVIAYGNCYSGNGTTVTAIAVSDNQGGTSYTEDGAASLTDGNGPQAARITLRRRQNITTGSPFTLTYDATGGGTTPYWFVIAFEVAGLAASPVDSGGGGTVNNHDLDTDVSVTGGALAQVESLAFAGMGISYGNNTQTITLASPWTVEAESSNGLTSTEGAIASRTPTSTDALTAAWSHANYTGDVDGRGCGFIVVYKGISGSPPHARDFSAFIPIYHRLHHPR